MGIVLLAACATAPRAPTPDARALVPASPPAPSPPSRFFHALPEAGFWVTHDEAVDRLVVEGARLELAPSGQVLRAAWDEDLLERGDVILGSVAAPPGGGFVHWTRNHLFRSSLFTGPITPIASITPEGAGLRGVRPGLLGLVAITDEGPRVIAAGSARLAPFDAPGVLDVVAASPTRAIQLDVFGRTTATFDGGRTWQSLTSSVGIAARAVSADDGELGVETWQGRFLVGPGGKLAPAEASRRGGSAKPFQLVWSGSRVDRDEASYGYREVSPFQAAVLAGAAIGDGTAYGVAQNVIARIDLATFATVSLVPDGVQSGLECQPLRSGADVLFACTWEPYQGAGGYVLRSHGGALPVVERVFTDAGSFVADDDGALGYTGACAITPHHFDPDEASRREEVADPPTKPILCVRRAPARPGAPAEWIERTVEIERPGSLAAWAPRRDGTAVALVIGGAALPDPVGAPRAREQGGVRVIRVDRALEGWSFLRPAWAHLQRVASRVLDKRWRARADGAIDGWLASTEEGVVPVWIGVTVAADGTTALHSLPPALGSMQVTGDFGAAISRHGELFETLDHGLTWRAAGASPLPPSAASSGGCSALGCVLGPLVRLGWGEAVGLTVNIASEPSLPPPTVAALPRLACVLAGGPIPVVPPLPLPIGLKQTIATTWGDSLDLARERTTPEVAPPPAPAPAPSAAAAPKPPRGAHAALAEKRTHTLLFRLPLAPFAAEKRLDVLALGFTAQRRSTVTPLLGAAGEIDLLLGGETVELLIAGDHVAAAPAFELRRYGGYSDGFGAGGLAIGADRSLLLGELRRRLTLEDHRASPPPPLLIGTDRETTRRRAMTLGRSEAGVPGVLVFDGAAPDTVGVAPIDPAGTGVLALARLAPWSTVTLADDPRCKAPDPTAYRALVVLDPSTWLALDPRSLPGVTLGRQALAEVRWGRSRVCLAALDAAVIDTRRRGDGARRMRLVVRWDGKGAGSGGADPAPNGALRAADLRQDLRCALAPPEAPR